MKKLQPALLVFLVSMSISLCNQAQSPNIRSLSGFIFFTTVGAIGNTGLSQITGHVGTGGGAVTGFDAPTIFTGSIFNANAVTTQVNNDLLLLYNELIAAAPTNTTHTPAFGGGETLLPGVYTNGGAGSIGGLINLDAAGNPDAVFIFRFGGAFTTGAGSVVTLLNGAKACNIFWVAEGAIAMAANTEMKGTLLAHPGAVSMAAGGILQGRMLSTAGAISVNIVNNTASNGCQQCYPQAGVSTWLGVDSDWQNINNWCGGIPLSSTNVVIPFLLQNYPQITNGSAYFNDINIQQGASVVVSGTGVCNLFGSITNAGLFDATDGTINITGTNQVLGASNFLSGTLKNLTISSGSASSIAPGVANMLRIKNNISFLTSNNTFTTNGNLTLLSNAVSTASCTDISNNLTLTGNSISGNVFVERFIPALKRWRFLAINTDSGLGSKNSFQENWMEGQAPGVNNGPAGRGLLITDAGYTVSPANFDDVSYAPSVKWFNGTGYVGIGNPLTYDIRNHEAYFTYVRGDRGSTSVNGIVSSTVLQTFGKLIQGEKTVAVPAGANSIGTGNPYASAIDLTKISFSTDDVINIYLWDPNIGGGGVYGQGGFQLLSRDPLVDQDFTILPGGGSYGIQPTMNIAESGLGFFIQGALSNRNITFKETAKTQSDHAVFRTTLNTKKIEVKLLERNSNDSTNILDVFQVRMADNYNTGLDANDARKKLNSGENISSERAGTLLALEYRNSMMSALDTLFINSVNLKPKNYSFVFTSKLLNDPRRISVLIDKYIAQETVLNMDGTTQYDFTVTNAPASFNANRFLIVFRQATVLPLYQIDLSARKLPNGNISISWTNQSETNTDYYELQKSSDATFFKQLGPITNANFNTGAMAVYSGIDHNPNRQNNFYRIKAVGKNVEIQYSNIVKIASVPKEYFSVNPNPVIDKKIQISMNGFPSGEYTIAINETNGKLLSSTLLNFLGAEKHVQILMNENTTAGNYILTLINLKGFKKVVPITIL